jgi:hypothetical protein
LFCAVLKVQTLPALSATLVRLQGLLPVIHPVICAIMTLPAVLVMETTVVGPLELATCVP